MVIELQLPLTRWQAQMWSAPAGSMHSHGSGWLAHPVSGPQACRRGAWVDLREGGLHGNRVGGATLARAGSALTGNERVNHPPRHAVSTARMQRARCCWAVCVCAASISESTAQHEGRQLPGHKTWPPKISLCSSSLVLVWDFRWGFPVLFMTKD